MMDILNIKDYVVKGLFYSNLISLIVIIFASSRAVFIIFIIINVILSGTLMVMNKMGEMFIIQFNKLLKK